MDILELWVQYHIFSLSAGKRIEEVLSIQIYLH